MRLCISSFHMFSLWCFCLSGPSIPFLQELVIYNTKERSLGLVDPSSYVTLWCTRHTFHILGWGIFWRKEGKEGGREKGRKKSVKRIQNTGLSWWCSGKEFTHNVGNAGVVPGSGRSPREGNGNPLQYSCLGNPMTEGPCGLQFMDCRSWMWLSD